MNWIKNLSNAIDHIEKNLTSELSLDEISRKAFSSTSHFQLIFHLVTGITVGEYIRNRRMSLAAQELSKPGTKVHDVAARYQYETAESFSKAFARFHGFAPSKLEPARTRLFNPFTINISITGGFEMSWKIADEFHLLDWNEVDGQNELSPEEKYKCITQWASKARGRNPGVFDALCDWLMNDEEWTADKLAENEQILMHGVLARFKEQNARLRTYLKELEPSGVVNPPVFAALGKFDKALAGDVPEWINASVKRMFADFSCMLERDVRKGISGEKTGRHGVDNADSPPGFIGYLKGEDAHVQWTLFMPDLSKQQQQGFQVDSFEYVTLPAVRFIGKYNGDHDTPEWRKELFDTLDSMTEHKSSFEYDLMLGHHCGKGIDQEPWHPLWGRFMKADTPVPEGFVHWDFVPEPNDTPHFTFRSQFAFAKFSGDINAMHSNDGYAPFALYEVTRNIVLGQGVIIPYPEGYWTAEVWPDGACAGPHSERCTAYMFSAVI